MRTIWLSLSIYLLTGPVLAVCPAANNVIANCGFEVDTSSWTLALGDSLTRTTAAARTGVASGEVNFAEAGFFQIRSTCRPLAASTTYGYGAFIRHVSGALPTTCKAQLRTNTDGACSTSPVFLDTPLIPINSGSWSPAFRAVSTGAAVQSGWLDVSCVGGDDTTVVRVDDIFLGVNLEPALFTNGFE